MAIPPEGQASRVFNQLFLQGSPAEVEAQVRELDTGRSILDVVGEQAKDLQQDVGARDRARLDQYFTSVRDLEHRLQESKGWANKPKPKVKASAPTDPASPAQYMAKVQVMYDLARLAFETDSTRAITLMLNSVGTPVVQIAGETITDSYHNLSHHGMAEEKLKQLKVIDEWHMKLLADLFKGLKAAKEGGETLLDRTMVLYGSNLGDANAHSTTNLPTLFAGGGFKHGQHLAFDRDPQLPAAEPVRLDAAAAGDRGGELRPLDRHDARPGGDLSHAVRRDVVLGTLAGGPPADEVAITFDKVETGKPVASYKDKDRGVVFALARKPSRSKAAGRVMFFPHLKTDREGHLERDGPRVDPRRGPLPEAGVECDAGVVGLDRQRGARRGLRQGRQGRGHGEAGQGARADRAGETDPELRADGEGAGDRVHPLLRRAAGRLPGVR